MPSACRPVPGWGCWSLLIAANAGQIPYSVGSREPAPTTLHSSYAQSRKQSAALITLFDLNDDIRGNTFVCASSTNSLPFDTLAFFPSLLVIMYRFFCSPEIRYNEVLLYIYCDECAGGTGCMCLLCQVQQQLTGWTEVNVANCLSLPAAAAVAAWF